MVSLVLLCFVVTNRNNMNTLQFREKSLELMQEHGLTASGWRLCIDTSKGRLGQCRESCREIGISLFHIKLHSWEQVRDTVLHEIAHALVGCHNQHGDIWRRKAIEIGCTGNRCGTYRMPTEHYKWVATCGDCGRVYRRHRLIAGVRRGACPCGEWNEIRILQWQEVKKANVINKERRGVNG